MALYGRVDCRVMMLLCGCRMTMLCIHISSHLLMGIWSFKLCFLARRQFRDYIIDLYALHIE